MSTNLIREAAEAHGLGSSPKPISKPKSTGRTKKMPKPANKAQLRERLKTQKDKRKEVAAKLRDVQKAARAASKTIEKAAKDEARIEQQLERLDAQIGVTEARIAA